MSWEWFAAMHMRNPVSYPRFLHTEQINSHESQFIHQNSSFFNVTHMEIVYKFVPAKLTIFDRHFPNLKWEHVLRGSN